MKTLKNLRVQAKFLLLLVFLTSMFSSCTNEYFTYHEKQAAFKAGQQENKKLLSTWNADTIGEIGISLYSSPGDYALERIISTIDGAKKRIYIEMYMLSEKRIIDALVNAKNRQVVVRVILEPNPYGNPYINKKSFATLEKAGIPVVWADDKRFVFTHAKFMLVDDVYVVMTANMTHSAFVSNREFFCEGKDISIFKVLSDIFEADFTHEPIIKSHPNLVISPIDSKGKIESLLSSAKKSILLYTETFDDTEILSLLREKVNAGIKITIIMTHPSKVSSNQKNIDTFQALGISVFAPKKPTIHAKVVIVDNSVAFVGSENFTTNSLNKNREIGLIFKDKTAITKIIDSSISDRK